MPKAKMKIIDMHNHPDWHGYNLEKFIENMNQNNIARTWLLTWECPDDEHNPDFYYCYGSEPLGENGPISFARNLAYVEKAPDRFVLGYAPDPRLPGAIDKLKAAVEIYGVKVYGELKVRAMYDNPDIIRMFKFCGEKKLPVIVHLEYPIKERAQTYPRPNYWYGGGIEAFERAIKQCPETTFLGHAPEFWAHISGDNLYKKFSYPKEKVKPGGKLPKMLRKYPNLYCDWSAGSGCNAFTRDMKFARDFALEFQDRVLFARDSFGNQHMETLKKLKLSKSVMEKILFKNALKMVPEKS